MPNKQAIALCRRKNEVRELLKLSDPDEPKSFLITQETIECFDFKALKFPVIIKDNSGTGSQNIYRADSPAIARNHCDRLKIKKLLGDILIEEYLLGVLYSAEILVSVGQSRFLGFTGRILSDEPYFREEVVAFPVYIDQEKLNRAQAYLSDVLKLVGYQDGFAHIEFMILPDGKIRVVEINPRIGGVMLGLCFCAQYDFNIYSALVDFALNRVPLFFSAFDQLTRSTKAALKNLSTPSQRVSLRSCNIRIWGRNSR